MTALPRVLLLTDRSQLPLSRSLTRTVAECVQAGLTHVVLRELDLSTAQRAATLAALVEVGATVISAHGLMPGAVGVHLPSAWGNTLSGEVAACRSGRVPVRTACYPLAGRSCHSRADVAAAASEGCDYVTLGPFAATDSKPGYGPALPLEEYDAHAVPVFALGGVTPANAAAARQAGAHGVAVMGAVMRSHEPAAVAAALLEAAP